jgi:D-lactate dehydrogenase
MPRPPCSTSALTTPPNWRTSARGLLQQVAASADCRRIHAPLSAFEASERYGKDLFLFIHHFGTERLMQAFAIKSRVDAWLAAACAPAAVIGRAAALRLAAATLPARLTQYRDRYQHHLLLKMSEDGAALRGLPAARMPSATGILRM